MHTLASLVLLLLWLMVSAAHGAAPDSRYVQSVHVSLMDWTDLSIIAGGADLITADEQDMSRRSVIAQRKARLNALKNIYDSLGQINLDSSTSIGQALEMDPSAARDFSAMVKQAAVHERVRTAGRSHLAEVFVILDFRDEQTRVFMPELLFAPVLAADPGEGTAAVPGSCQVFIDAADSGVSPAIIPSILDEQGNILFRASILGSGKRSASSTVSYMRRSLEGDGFKTISPQGQTLWIRSTGYSGKLGTDVMLEGEVAERFRRVVSSARDGCSVTIILK